MGRKAQPMQCGRGKQRTNLRVWTVTASCTMLGSSGCQFTSGLLPGSIHNGSTHLESEEQLHNAWVAQAIQDVPLAPDVLHHLVPAAARTGSSSGLARDAGDVRAASTRRCGRRALQATDTNAVPPVDVLLLYQHKQAAVAGCNKLEPF